MSFSTVCDYCGESLYGRDYATMTVAVHRVRRSKLEAKWAEEVRPTRHFCVPEHDEDGYDRLGLPDKVDALEESRSCYGRAIAMLKGTPTELPDAGMEWRLVPIGGARLADEPTDKAETPLRGDALIQHCKENRALVDAPGGIGWMWLKTATHFALVRARLYRIADIEALEDGELLAVNGIGASRLREIREATTRYYSERPDRTVR